MDAGAGFAVAPASDSNGQDAWLGGEAARQRARLRRAAENEKAQGASGEGSMSKDRWLAVVGVGEDGIDGLTPAARRLVAQADLVVGGERHLALVGSLAARDARLAVADRGRAARNRSPAGQAGLRAGDRRSVLLRRRDDADAPLRRRRNDLRPRALGLCLAAARLGWSQQDCATLSLHGRPLEAIIPHLQPAARILALSWDATTPGKLAALLASRGMGRSTLTVCEAMGGPRERVRAVVAADFALDDVAALNTIALEVVADPAARILPRAAGLPDEWFEHDGQITKRDIRAITLSALAPRRGELLWDVGSGSGSVAIEWMLADPANRAIAIEARADRADRIARNALALGAPALSVVDRRGAGGAGGTAFAGRGVHRRRGERARNGRTRDRGAGAGRPAGRQRGDAGDAGPLRRLARPLGRRPGADFTSPTPSRSGAFPAGARRCRSCNGG